MKNIAILALFLVSLTGYGQITSKQANLILSDNGVKQGEPTYIWEGWSHWNYETPHGVFIITTEWIKVDTLYDIVTYQFINDTLKRFDLLNNYVIYDYSKDQDLFLVRKRTIKNFTKTETNGGDVYTYSLVDNKFTFQFKNEVKNATSGKIKDVKFISSGNEIQYEYYASNGKQYIKERINVK